MNPLIGKTLIGVAVGVVMPLIFGFALGYLCGKQANSGEDVDVSKLED